jgi:hypothetical protein
LFVITAACQAWHPAYFIWRRVLLYKNNMGLLCGEYIKNSEDGGIDWLGRKLFSLLEL